MKKILPLLLCVFCACSKKPRSVAEPSPLSYSVTFDHDLQIAQYEDTTVALPIVLEHLSGLTGVVSLTSLDLPGWSRCYEAPIISHLSDTGKYSLCVLKLRFHPFQAGSYDVSFATTSSPSDTQVHRISVVVTPAMNCSRYLLGDYSYVTKCTYYGSTQTGTITVKDSKSVDSVYVMRYKALVNCTQRILSFSGGGSKSSSFGNGYFNGDTISLRTYKHVFEPDELFDTCDVLLIRKW